MKRLIHPTTHREVLVSDESAVVLKSLNYKEVEPVAVEEPTPTAPAPSVSKPRVTRSRKTKAKPE